MELEKQHHRPGAHKATLSFPQVGHRPCHHPRVAAHQITAYPDKTPGYKMWPIAQLCPALKLVLWALGNDVTQQRPSSSP